MAIMNRGAFPVLTTRAGLKKVYFMEYAAHKELWSMVLSTDSSSRGFEDRVKISNLGRMTQLGESEGIFYDRAVEGTRISRGHAMFGLGFQVSRVMFDDDQYGIMKRMSEALARSVKYEQEVRAFAIFNDAQAGNTFTGFDGLALLSNAHTLLNDAGTVDNRIQADLSVSSLEAAIDLFATVTDDANMELAIEPKVLAIPAQLRWLAAQLLDSQFDPESANNATNPLHDVGLSWFASPFITDTDMWMVLADKSQHDLRFTWRLRPETEDERDFDTKGLKFSAIQRFSVGWDEFRGTVGSMGI